MSGEPALPAARPPDPPAPAAPRAIDPGADAFARRIVDEGTISDPWIDGEARFSPEPHVLSQATARLLSRAAESAALAWDEVGRIVAEEEPLLERFFHLTPVQRALWLSSRPRWHGVARADLFLGPDGPRVAELNCDTPTGQAETVVLAALAGERPGLSDPSAGLAARWTSMVEAYAARSLDAEARGRKVAAIVYPTELTEDLPLVRIYRRWLEAAGYRVLLGSPFNLGRSGDDLLLFDEPVSLLLRHYKTDWWTERQSAWDDEELADPLPLVGPLAAVLEAQLARRCAVVNPFGAVLQQNKRAMALMWELVHRFSTEAQAAIRAFVPPTFRAEAMHREQLLAQRAEWVLKSDYGSEGDEVIVGKEVSDDLWNRSLAHARPGRWIVQQYFETTPEPSGALANHGVWLVAGEACGHYTRTSTGPTDVRAVSAATLVETGAG